MPIVSTIYTTYPDTNPSASKKHSRRRKKDAIRNRRLSTDPKSLGGKNVFTKCYVYSIYEVHPSEDPENSLKWFQYRRVGDAYYNNWYHRGRDQHDCERVYAYKGGLRRVGDEDAVAHVTAGTTPDLPDPNQLVVDADAVLAFISTGLGETANGTLARLRAAFAEGMPACAIDLREPIQILRKYRGAGTAVGASSDLRARTDLVFQTLEQLCADLTSYAIADVMAEYRQTRTDAPLDQRIESAVRHLTEYVGSVPAQEYRETVPEKHLERTVFERLSDRLVSLVNAIPEHAGACTSATAHAEAVRDFQASLGEYRIPASDGLGTQLYTCAWTEANLPPLERLARFDERARALEAIRVRSNPDYARTFTRLSGALLAASAADICQDLLACHGRGFFARQIGRLTGHDPKDEMPIIDARTRQRLMDWSHGTAWHDVRAVARLPKTRDAQAVASPLWHARRAARSA